MGQVARIGVGTGDVQAQIDSLYQQIGEILLVLDDFVEFGDPSNPEDPEFTSPALLAGEAGTGTHNGTVSNINGSWVEVKLETFGLTVVTCTHNLYLSDPGYAVPVAGQPNCRWLLFGIMHDGDGKDGEDTLESSRIGVDIAFIEGTVNANDIQLRMNLRMEGSTMTISDVHPVLVTLFFTKATRGE